jgi:hypothetical protein
MPASHWLSLFLAAVSVVAAVPVSAQSTAARLSGVVFDQQHALLPGASIGLRNLDTGLTRSTISGPDGRFGLLGLPPGRYEVTFQQRSFGTIVKALELAIDEDAELDVVLPLAAIAQDVQVTVEAPLVEPSRTDLGRTIVTQQIDQLPVAGRDFTALALLSPGLLVNQVATGSTTGIATAGQTGRNNTFLLDGLTLDDTWAAAARASPPLDAIREFVVLSNGFNAEYGQASGAVVSVTTKSGANQSAGRVYYFHRDDAWDATSHAARLVGLSDSVLEQKIAGGFIGGPIVRDHAFYFGSVEDTLLDTENIVTSPVLQTFRPNDPIHTPARSRILQLFGRSDLRMDSSQLTFRARGQRSTMTDRLAAGDVGVAAPERGFDVTTRPYDVGVLHNFVSGTSRLNEFRFQLAQGAFDRDPSAYCAGCPDEGRPTIKLGKPSTVPNSLRERRVQLADSFTYMPPPSFGDHSVKIGMDISAIGDDWHDLPDADGTFTFQTDLPFKPAIATTYPTKYTRTLGDPHVHLDHTTWAGFVQDRWKPRANVTINGGLRWDYDHALGVSGDVSDFAPRVAVAFDPSGIGSITLRGGYGRYYDQIPLGVAKAAEQARTALQILIKNPGYPDPFGFNPNSSSDPRPNTTRLATMAMPYTDQATFGVQRRLSSQIAATVDLVYARGRRLLVTHDLNYPDLSDPIQLVPPRPNPAFQRVLAVESRGNSWYRGLQVGIEGRNSGRYSYSAAYTWSLSERDTEDYTFVPQDQRDFAAERGPAANDVRHRLAASLTAELPFELQLTTVITVQSALPYTITTNNDDNGDTNTNDRPLGVGRNSARGDDFSQADVRLSRLFRTRFCRLEALVEAFNVANRANWSGFDGRQNSQTYGRPTTALPGRQVQAALRLDF